jgi:hypothetical protein
VQHRHPARALLLPFLSSGRRLKKRYIRKADAKKVWAGYSREREIQKQRTADRREFRQLCRDLRRIDAMLAGLSISNASQQGTR